MSNAINSKGVSLADIFDPYVAGTTKARATAIGDASNDTSNLYANIIYGSAAAATGIQSKSADINTLYAKKGTASYALPIDGQTYESAVQIVGNPASATINFAIAGGNTWSINASNTRGIPAPQVLAAGAVPTGSTTVKYTWGAYIVGSGKFDAGGSTTNGATSPTSVSGNPTAVYTTSLNASNSGSRDREYPFTVDFYNSKGANISHSVCTLICDTEGSV